MHTRRTRRFLRGALCLALALPLLLVQPAFAEGDEEIGEAQLELAEATGVVMGGVSLLDQPATLDVEVPAGATVEQVLVHWVGMHWADVSGDDTLTLDGSEITGTLIGGPVKYSWRWRTSAYRADITDLGLVGPGANSLTVDDSDFAIRSDGISITVLYSEEGEEPIDLDLRDGADVVSLTRPGLQKTSVAQTFTVPEASEARSADVLLAVADADEIRPQDVLVTIDGVATSYPDLLGNGGLFDAVTLPVEIPAGVTEVTVEVRSIVDPERPEVKPSSMVWILGGLSVDPPAPSCVFFTPTASGRAFGLDIAAAPIVGPQGPFVDTDEENPAGPAIPLDLDPLPITDFVLQAVNDLDLAPDRATDHAIAVVNDLDITLGDYRISADTIVASSLSAATQQSATSTSAGSRIQNLVISQGLDSTTYGDITSEEVIELGGGAFPLLRVTALGTTTSGAAAGEPQPDAGLYASSLAVDGLRIEFIDPVLSGNQLDVDIVVGHAESDASVEEPRGDGCPEGTNLHGRAFVVSVDEVPNDGFGVISGEVVLPSVGGDESTTLVDVVNLGGSATGSSSTVGDPTVPSVDSKASVENLDLFNQGAIIADLIEAWSSSTAIGETGGAIIAGLSIGGNDVCAGLGLDPICTPEPNTVYGDPSIGIIVLNQQIPSPDGLIVNAVHVMALGASNPSFPTGLDVVIASAESDATR